MHQVYQLGSLQNKKFINIRNFNFSFAIGDRENAMLFAAYSGFNQQYNSCKIYSKI